METQPIASVRHRPSTRLVVGLLVALGIAVFIAANVHFVIIAIQSQPECLVHEKVGEGGDGYSASGSAC